VATLPDEKTLRSLYIDQLLPESAIAKKYGTYQVKINRLRRKYGIAPISKTERLQLQLPALTELQKKLLIGSLMGDGGLTAPSDLSARFGEGHSEAQAGYLKWKADLLGEYTSCVYPTSKTNK